MSGTAQQQSPHGDPATAVPARPPSRHRPGWVLAVAMLGFSWSALDAQVVNVAMIDIRADLGGGLSGLQWVITGYTLAFAALPTSTGRPATTTSAAH